MDVRGYINRKLLISPVSMMERTIKMKNKYFDPHKSLLSLGILKLIKATP
jgi:hypothetical protein